MTTVDIFVDPACPYAWMTSQWMIQVEQVRDVTTRFNLMSLAVLNENREDADDAHRAKIARLWQPVRVAMAVEHAGGKGALRAFYLAYGTLHHNGGAPFSHELTAQALERAGLDPALADREDDTSLDDAVRASHADALTTMKNDVGTPIVRFPNGNGGTTAYFGPVFSPPPAGDDAGRLWDAILTVAAMPGFWELKRSRTVPPAFLPMDGLA